MLTTRSRCRLSSSARWRGACRWSLLAGLALGPVSAPLAAGDGDLLDFNTMPFDSGGDKADRAAAVAVQSDGKLVVAGTISTGAGTYRLGLTRFLANGLPDTGFGTGGLLVDPFGFSANSTGVALQRDASDGLLVAGTVDRVAAGDQDFYVGRLDANGAVDGSFGLFGAAIVSFDLGSDYTDVLSAMALDRAGRILLAGSVDVSVTDIDIGVARVTSVGTLDGSFSDDGKAVVAPSTGIDLGLAVTPYVGGGVVVGGAAWQSDPGGHFALLLARLRGDGDPEGGFGTAGLMTMPWIFGGTNNAVVWGVAVWPDGEIAAAADVATGSAEWRVLLAQFAANGDYVDGMLSRFCLGSVPPCPAAAQDSPRALLMQGDGELLMAGFGLGISGTTDFALARFERPIGYDASFGSGGITLFDFSYGTGAGADTGTALAFDRDGRIVVAGFTEFNGLDTDYAWARFDNALVFADGFEWSTSHWSATVP